jgi:hypothetical protein
MKKYGISFAFHSNNSKIKSKSTCKERYGAEYPMQVKNIQEKMRKSCMEKLGVDYPLKSAKIQQQITKTMLSKYGVEKPAQIPEIMSKILRSCFSTKIYLFPSGRAELCQGYEPQCLNHLLTIYKEDDIVVGSSTLPPIWYDNQETGKKSRYYPDAYIISENMVIEVKSWWTFKKDYNKNVNKFKRIVEMGFKMVLYICNKKEFIEKHVYTVSGVVVEPAHSAEIVFED